MSLVEESLQSTCITMSLSS